MRRWLILGMACVVFSSFTFGGCRRPTNIWEETPGKGPKLLASFPPIYCMVKKVAPEAKVHCLLTTVGPHDYRPTSDDTIVVQGADLFFGIGMDLDEHVLYKLANTTHRLKNLVRLGPPLEKEELLYEMRGSDTGAYDPHIWLGIPQMKAMVQVVADTLVEKYPDKKDAYLANAKKYQSELDQLLDYGKSKLKDKKNRKLVTAHESLLYFEKSFGVEVVDSVATHAGVGLGPARLAEVEEKCLKKDVRVLASEPQYSGKALKTLQENLAAKDHKVTIIEIDPIETSKKSDFTDADYYVTVMRKNLDALAKSLP